MLSKLNISKKNFFILELKLTCCGTKQTKQKSLQRMWKVLWLFIVFCSVSQE